MALEMEVGSEREKASGKTTGSTLRVWRVSGRGTPGPGGGVGSGPALHAIDKTAIVRTRRFNR
jgi:hypothetical protein